MEIKEQIRRKAKEIETVIARFLPEESGFQKTVFEAMNYSVMVGGKRLRPMLMLETYRLFGGKDTVVEPFMAAIEMIHTYSLVHDDLPAMDNDEFRRGKKTTHAVYGEAMGILTGDALLNFAYETAAKAWVEDDVSAEVGKAFLVLSQKAGVYGMVGGQVVDVESEKADIRSEISVVTKEKLDFIYRLKTGALMEASMMIGAILAKADAKEIAKVEKIAAKVGMAFQIQDDILDVTGTLETLGKPIGSDEKNHKLTFVSFEGIQKAQEEVARLSEEAIALLEELPGDKTFIKDLLIYLIHREN